ncbi:MAG: hypothetical protein EA398_17200 [Deltaproteobacteria bacterium]|nr:MAG: hypothetical protein EA398_17200 [Deltaproteobacteria bacterium]
MPPNDPRSARLAGRAAALLLTGALASPAVAAESETDATPAEGETLHDGEAVDVDQDGAVHERHGHMEQRAKINAQGSRDLAPEAEEGTDEDADATDETLEEAGELQQRPATRQEERHKQQQAPRERR